MANWEKLNAEFDSVIDNMTDEDWRSWEKNRKENRLKRKANMQTKCKQNRPVKPALFDT